MKPNELAEHGKNNSPEVIGILDMLNYLSFSRNGNKRINMSKLRLAGIKAQAPLLADNVSLRETNLRQAEEIERLQKENDKLRLAKDTSLNDIWKDIFVKAQKVKIAQLEKENEELIENIKEECFYPISNDDGVSCKSCGRWVHILSHNNFCIPCYIESLRKSDGNPSDRKRANKVKE